MNKKVTFQLIFTMTILLAVTQCKLVYLLEFFRHGAKYPSNNMTAFTDPANLRGQLTGVGQRQQYLLGSYLHHDYIVGQKLVSGQLNGRQVQIFSSSYQRAIDSAYSHSYGLFPTQDSYTIPQNFPQNFLIPPFSLQQNLQRQSQNNNGQTPNYALYKGFQPPQVIVDDTLVNYCPNYKLLLTQRLNDISANLSIFQAQHQKEITRLVNIFNVSISKGAIGAMFDLYDDVISNIFLGRQLPKQFTDQDMKNLKFISDYYRLMVQTGGFGETLITPLLRFIDKRFNEVQLRQTEKKLTIFSCHAENIIQFQTILNLTSVDCLSAKRQNKATQSLNCMNLPDFASSLLFEVHENEEETSTFRYDVKVKYNGKYVNLCEKKSQVCEISEFLQRITNYVSKDFEQQCGILLPNELQTTHILKGNGYGNRIVHKQDDLEWQIKNLFMPE